MNVTPITADELRKRVELAYGNMGELAVSLNGMAFLAGVLTACDTVAGIGEAARFDKLDEMKLPTPAAPICQHTIDYLMTHLKALAMHAAEGTVIMEPLTSEEGPPSGVKMN